MGTPLPPQANHTASQLINFISPTTVVKKAQTNKQNKYLTNLSRNNKLCAWRHDMPPPLSSPCGRPSASRVAEQTQRSSSFPRPICSHGHRCTCLTR